MGSKTTRVTTSQARARVAKKLRQGLDRLPTRQAQIIRMRQGLSEPAAAVVGQPAADCLPETTERLLELEEIIRQRFRAAAADNPVKSKIVEALKRRR